MASIGLFAQSAALAQHGAGGQHGSTSVQRPQGPGRHMPGAEQTAVYDTKAEATFKGAVEDVKAGAHTMGPARMAGSDRQLVLKTETGAFDVRLVRRPS
jgi:hypothetical protein